MKKCFSAVLSAAAAAAISLFLTAGTAYAEQPVSETPESTVTETVQPGGSGTEDVQSEAGSGKTQPGTENAGVQQGVNEVGPAGLNAPEAGKTDPAQVQEPEAGKSDPAQVQEPEADKTDPAQVQEPEAGETDPAQVQEPEAGKTDPAQVQEPEADENDTAEPDVDKTDAALTGAAPLMRSDDAVTADEQVMDPDLYWVNLGQTVSTPPRSETDPLISNHYDYGTLFYIYAKGEEIDSFSAKNIVSSVQEEACTMWLPSYSGLRVSIVQELLRWGKEHGKNWTEDTQITGLAGDITKQVDFLDANGNPADFVRSADNPGDDFAAWPGGIWQMSGDVQRTDTASMLKRVQALSGSDGRLGDMGYFEMLTGSTAYKFNKDYLGKLTINSCIKLRFSFMADGMPYEITLLTPDAAHTFEVEKVDTQPQVSGEPDADLQAVVTHDGTASPVRTENDQVTAVQHGDEITYRIEAGGEATAQMFYKYLQDLIPLGNIEYSQEVKEWAKNHDVDLMQAYMDAWSQPADTYLDFSLTIPKGLEYDEARLSEITLEQPDTNVMFYTLDSEGSTYVWNEETGEGTIRCRVHLDLERSHWYPYPEPGWMSSYESDMLEQIARDVLTLIIPGTTVSDQAEAAKLYTAKATIAGDFFCPYESVLGSSAPAAAKPDTGSNWDDEDVWDDEASVQTYGVMKTAVVRTAVNDSDTRFPFNNTTNYTTNMDMKQFIPYTHYIWYHLQNDDGRDCIQQEEHSRELWYTVVIPGLRVEKNVEGEDVDKEEYQKPFNFTVQLSDQKLFGQTVRASISNIDAADEEPEWVDITFDENGKAQFKLMHHQSIAMELPVGTAYTVTEEDGSAYRVAMISADGTMIYGSSDNGYTVSGIVSLALNAEKTKIDTVVFNNSPAEEQPPKTTKTTKTNPVQPTAVKEASVVSAPKTGDTGNPALYAGLMAAAGAALLLIAGKRRKNAQ